MTSSPSGCRSGAVPSVNAQLYSYLRAHPPSSASDLILDGLRRYPLPMLTGAAATDVAGMVPATAQPTSSRNSPAEGVHMYEGLHVAADAIHRFWQATYSSSLLVSSSYSPLSSDRAEERLSPHSPDLFTTREAAGTTGCAAWLAQSPFRMCARTSFHAQLRRCATPAPSPPPSYRTFFQGQHTNRSTGIECTGGLFSSIDAMCHGFRAAVEEVKQGPSHTRKRLRAAPTTPDTAKAVDPSTQRAQQHGEVCSRKIDGRLNTSSEQITTESRVMGEYTAVRAEVEGTEVCVASPALRSRVAENDDLLGMLLGVPTTAPPASFEKSNGGSNISEGTAIPHREGLGEGNDEETRRLRMDPEKQFHCSSKPVPSRDAPAHTASAPSETDLFGVPAPVPLSRAAGGVGRDLPPLLCGAAAVNDDDEASLANCSVKALKDMCNRHGLLTTGPKSVLLQRIHLYKSSVQQANDTAVVAQERQLCSSSCTQAAVTPPALTSTRSASGSPPRTVFRYRSPSASPVAATTTAGSPASVEKAPTATAHSLSLAAIATGSGGLITSMSRMEAVLDTSDASTSPPITSSRSARRLVPSPVEFVQQLMTTHQKQLRQQQQASASSATARSTCQPSEVGFDFDGSDLFCESASTTTTTNAAVAAYSSSPPAAPAASRAQEEDLKSEVANVRWQWLVDYRERAGAHRGGRSKHEGMMDAFRRQQVPCTSVLLPGGDFMLAVDLSAQEAAELRQTRDQSSDAAAAAAAAVHAESQENRKKPSPAPPVNNSSNSNDAYEGKTAVCGHVCSLVVERKTAADLDASVKGSRYTEQRRLLTVSPYALVVWLIEGSDVDGGGRGGKRGFFASSMTSRRGGREESRSPSPVPANGGSSDDMLSAATSTSSAAATSPASPHSPAESARLRVDSACASLGLQKHGWLVVRTRNTAESVQFLKLLAGQVVRQLARRRLAQRTSPQTALSAFENESHYAEAIQLFRLLPSSAPSFSSRESGASLSALLQFAPMETCLRCVGALQRRLRARTAFPRMLMCVRGCSPSLAALLSKKYGSFMGFWRALRRHGREACDSDPDIQRLSTAQKKVFVLLTEFLLAKDYY